MKWTCKACSSVIKGKPVVVDDYTFCNKVNMPCLINEGYLQLV